MSLAFPRERLMFQLKPKRRLVSKPGRSFLSRHRTGTPPFSIVAKQPHDGQAIALAVGIIGATIMIRC
jgi:hypothetical protein